MQQLLNPFAQKYPEAVDCTLSSQATSVRFNKFGPFAGHYLAAGGSDGVVEIWDVETRGLVRILEGHVKAVGALCWSRNNRYLLSCSFDSTIIIWNLSVLSNPLLHPSNPSSPGSSTSRIHTIRFDAPVTNAQFHPRNCKIVLATLTCNEVVLVDLRAGGGKVKLEDVVEEAEGDGEGEEEPQPERQKATLACAAFSPCGSRIYAGSTQGELLIFDPPSKTVLHRYKVANAAIRQIAFDPRGQTIILSSTDRALRVLLVSPLTGLLTPTHRFQDLINRTSWNAIGFSGDGEYVMGGAGHKMAHNVFIWDRGFGTLVKVLEGPRESLVDSDWHPTRPVIATVATSGDIHLWQTSSPDNWAAFAPGFEELEENVEYDEREDEFDIEDETELSRRKDLEEDLDIDVLKPDDSFPRRPSPVLCLPPSFPPNSNSTPTSNASVTGTSTPNGEESEEVRSIRYMTEAARWADVEGDDDHWQGFFLSLDLLNPEEG